MAVYRGDEQEFAAVLQRDADALITNPPRPPDGAAVDPRVVHVQSGRTDGAGKLAPDVAAQTPTHLVRIGFSRTRAEQVAEAAGHMGFLVASLGPSTTRGEAATLAAKLSARASAEDKAWVAVVSGSAEQVAGFLDEVEASTLAAVCVGDDELGLLEIEPIDKQRGAASELGYARTDAQEVRTQLESEGYKPLVFGLGDAASGQERSVLDVVARVFRWTQPKPQALILSGPPQALQAFRGLRESAFDVIAYCTDRVGLDLLGLTPIDVDQSGEAAEIDPPELLESAPIHVAGRMIANPARAVLAYLAQHGGTVQNFDFAEAGRETVTAEAITATRRPWMNSRISYDQGEWFIETAKDAPWHLVAPDALLADADASEVGGLYDAAISLWDHFRRQAPKGVSVAKISKVLHLMRPGLIPILDSRLTALYEPAAKAAAKDVGTRRPDMAGAKQLMWEAVRLDLVANAEPLQDLRAALRKSIAPLGLDAAERLSDVRLLDILAWAIDGYEPA